MVYVVLRTGKVLVYNTGGAITVELGTISVRQTGQEPGLVARIPLDIVERVEFAPPCRIRRARKMPKRADY